VRRTTALAGALVLAGLLLLVVLGHGSGASATAAAQSDAGSPTGSDSFEPVLGMPARNVVVLGSSPLESHGEAWAYGTVGDVPAIVDGVPYADQLVLLEHTEVSGWQVVPLPPALGGGPLSPATINGAFPEGLGALGGRVTSAGGVVLLTAGGIVVRDPGGAPRLVPGPNATEALEEKTEGEHLVEAGHDASSAAEDSGAELHSELLLKGESLPPATPPAGVSTPYAATDETDGHTGLLIAPYHDGVGAEGSDSSAAGQGILHYDGEKWTRESILWKRTKEEEDLTPEALACGGTSANESSSSPENCWLLASYRVGPTGQPNRLALFRRTQSTSEPSTYTWDRVEVADWLLGKQPAPSAVTGATSVMGLGAEAQALTVTSQGVWVDFQAKVGGSTDSTDFSELVALPSGESASVTGTWCYPTIEKVCERTLGASLPTSYRSFAWPESSLAGVGGDPDLRVLTGLPGGAMLELAGGDFQYTIGAGGGGDGTFGAAFDLSAQGSIEQGWIGEGEASGADDQGQSQIVDVTPQPQGDQLQQMPVPFRHPLLALAQAPGSTPGEPGAAAIAVGAKGEIGRFTPGQGWRSESLYNSSGDVQTPTLRGVAWPEPNRAYAVGDQGAMWVWHAETGLWEPDPAAPYNFIGNLTAIAFSPSEPALGYAVGKQGVLLKYGKTWEQVQLPAELQQVNFTSVAFAGKEVLATYRTVVQDPKRDNEWVESGGLAVEEGSGWHIDSSVATLLAELSDVGDTVLSKVAGLPDGGAVAAGPGLVIEHESESSEVPWSFSSQPLPEAQNVSALAAYREASGSVRAVVSIDLDRNLNPNAGDLQTNAYSGDLPPPTGLGQPPPHLSTDPLPDTGYVLKQTDTGWSDIEHMALEATGAEETPVRPDPVLALLVNPSGSSGLAVGGQTDDADGSPPSPDPFETAAAMRFGAGEDATGGDTSVPIATTENEVTFAVGGAAACVQPCSNFADESLAPDVLLSHALATANQIATGSPGGLRGFLYTGDRLPEDSSALGPETFQRELVRYAALLGSGGPLSVHAVASPKDLSQSGGIESFVKALEPFVPAGSVPAGASAPPAGTAAYAFESPGNGGTVRVIVLDFSNGTLEAPGAPEPKAQEEWLERELQAAGEHKTPAIVMGNASLGFALPEQIGFNPSPVQAKDAAAVSRILLGGGAPKAYRASVYLFDYPGANVQTQVSYGTAHIAAFGTGTLGYVSPPAAYQTDSLGSSGFLLVEVEMAGRNPSTNEAHVSARVEPNIGELAIDAADGVLLRRSHAGLFEALARVPPSGRRVQPAGASGNVIVLGPAPYEPIPYDCLGLNCADALPTDYDFSSSNPDVGGFVVHEASSNNPLEVKLNAKDEPIPDELKGARNGQPVNEKGEPIPGEQSGLFCAYNEGTTTVTITAGGLSYSEPVTVQGGSAEYPCGTVPLKNPPPRTAPASSAFPIPGLAPTTPGSPVPHVQSIAPPPPVPLPALVPAHHPHRPVPLPPVPPAPAQLFPVLALVPPPAPNVARPTPPSGTAQVPAQSPVSQQVSVAEREHEEENAIEGVHNMAVYSPHSEEGSFPAWSLGLVLLAVAAAVGLRPLARSRRFVYVREATTRNRFE
jgi:hypothetical protein